MATRPRTSTRTTPPPDSPAPATATPLGMPAHNIWLAGLGALSGAQANAQAEGSKAFEALVKQGLEWQARTQALAKEKWAEAAERMGAMTAQATGGVGSWDRLGGIFEERVARALASMGMPSASEVAQLQARVEALETALNALQSGAPQPRPARARKR
ncbi:MAG: phasin family protein [Rubrivivax sp.]|nr:phasin family protein [Rubrivivax sp.]MCZ2088903.1 phasin family protein [Burkholderiales bacterium]TXI22695.1 MAG: poly(hydroxyalkanoate) granule-associated protein [Ottowia sp.]HOZ94909.1 phasin family protein [Ottowia sp.]HQO54371.1 phasin family protein [Ottowia sp.]